MWQSMRDHSELKVKHWHTFLLNSFKSGVWKSFQLPPLAINATLSTQKAKLLLQAMPLDHQQWQQQQQPEMVVSWVDLVGGYKINWFSGIDHHIRSIDRYALHATQLQVLKAYSPTLLWLLWLQETHRTHITHGLLHAACVCGLKAHPFRRHMGISYTHASIAVVVAVAGVPSVSNQACHCTLLDHKRLM